MGNPPGDAFYELAPYRQGASIGTLLDTLDVAAEKARVVGGLAIGSDDKGGSRP